MFEGFQAGTDRQSRRRFAASGGIALALYALVAIGIIAIASRPREKRPESGNSVPAFPDEMRKKGVEGLVVLPVLVGSEGRVADIRVVAGKEPFLSAAIEVVRSWRHEPARVDGSPTAVHRIIRGSSCVPEQKR